MAPVLTRGAYGGLPTTLGNRLDNTRGNALERSTGGNPARMGYGSPASVSRLPYGYGVDQYGRISPTVGAGTSYNPAQITSANPANTIGNAATSRPVVQAVKAAGGDHWASSRSG